MKEKQPDCKIHYMPQTITDADITALFNGILKVVKKKIELDKQAEILSRDINFEKLQKDYKTKSNECTRLKNEILALRAEIEKNKTFNS